MRWMAYPFFLLLVVWCVNADIFNDLLFEEPQSRFQAFEWDRPQFQSRISDGGTSESMEKDREPLAPDYKDPHPQGTEDKPVSTASTATNTKVQPVLNPKKETQGPKHPVNSKTNSGGSSIVDIDASTGGFPSLSSPFGPAFDFPALSDLGKPTDGFGFSGLFGINEGNKWWKGKNVCIEREESTEDGNSNERSKTKKDQMNDTETINNESNFFSTSIRLSNCFETENKYECITRVNNHGVVKTFTVRYKCCYGFRRTLDGCTKQIDLKPLLQTLEDMKLNEFRGLIKSSGLESTYENENYTVFVPNDDAFNDYNEKLNDINKVDVARRRRQLKNARASKDLILSHSINGFIEVADLENEQTLQSKDEHNSTIRINIYPTHTYEKMITANCARIKKVNILAENGVIHVVDRVIIPASERVEVIIMNNAMLTSFKKVLENTNILQHLKPDGHYTIFAATDDAFAKLDEVQRQKLLKGGSCATNILKHHIVAHTVCSSAILGNATTHNVEGTILNMERTIDDELTFEGISKIVQTDLMGTNGVVHLIDTLVIPESGQYIGNVLKSHNFSKFQDLVKRAGLTEELDNFDNATVFVPANQAFENPETKELIDKIGNDQEKLKKLVRYHIVGGQIQSCDMSNNMKISTKDNGEMLRVNLYSTLPLFTNVINRATINCARLIGFDEKTCGSIVHEVNKVLMPPNKNIFEIIQSDAQYSILKELLQGTEIEKILQENNRSITFLAPTDKSFEGLDEKDRNMLKENKEKAEEVLKNHVLTEMLCCSGVGPQTWGFNSFIPTFGNQRLEIGRTGNQIRVNRAVVIKCDILATNGVLHNIDKVLAPKKKSTTAIGGGFLFFDL